MTFARLCILIGILLVVVTVYAVNATQTSFVTAYLPAASGVLLIGLGIVAERNPSVLHQVILAATFIAGLALVGSLRILFIFNDPEQNLPTIVAHLTTLILSGCLSAVGVRLFLMNRRAAS
ncbi:MAG: hypothetical protein KC547_03385 [Anaerolineae bacterium]|nr:hypothetical protein [Anaerolineae bacterium]MCA9907065.1 hypothetical protein [Anaerolineae bacterium]